LAGPAISPSSKRRTTSLKLNIIIGSTRPGRSGPIIGRWFEEFAVGHGKFEVELVDLVHFNLPLLDEVAHPVLQQYEHEHTRRWSVSVASADAYVFVTPEYDYFPPASLVNAVQVVMREWAYSLPGSSAMVASPAAFARHSPCGS
jgi:NAD(P)H-dependent FMN reductase